MQMYGCILTRIRTNIRNDWSICRICFCNAIDIPIFATYIQKQTIWKKQFLS